MALLIIGALLFLTAVAFFFFHVIIWLVVPLAVLGTLFAVIHMVQEGRDARINR